MRNWPAAAAWIITAALAAAQPADRIYPGARVDAAGTEQARSASVMEPDLEVTVYFTADPFEKVLGHFEKKGHEFKVIGSRARKLPSGQELRDAFFILDDAPTLSASKRWVKLQRPYLGQYGLVRNASMPNEIRDVTAIVLSTRK